MPCCVAAAAAAARRDKPERAKQRCCCCCCRCLKGLAAFKHPPAVQRQEGVDLQAPKGRRAKLLQKRLELQELGGGGAREGKRCTSERAAGWGPGCKKPCCNQAGRKKQTQPNKKKPSLPLVSPRSCAAGTLWVGRWGREKWRCWCYPRRDFLLLLLEIRREADARVCRRSCLLRALHCIGPAGHLGGCGGGGRVAALVCSRRLGWAGDAVAAAKLFFGGCVCVHARTTYSHPVSSGCNCFLQKRGGFGEPLVHCMI